MQPLAGVGGLIPARLFSAPAALIAVAAPRGVVDAVPPESDPPLQLGQLLEGYPAAIAVGCNWRGRAGPPSTAAATRETGQVAPHPLVLHLVVPIMVVINGI